MTAAPKATPRISKEDLPSVRGKLIDHADLSKLTWFRVGGPADVLFQPADEYDLADFLRTSPSDIPVTTVGVGSNLLVRDGGVRGVVIRLGGPFAGIAIDGDRLTVGAAALDAAVAKRAAAAGVAGLEFLRGVPGAIGGALRMNAGAYGAELKDVFRAARAIDRRGHKHDVDAAAMGFAYRKTTAPQDWIFTAATLQGAPGDPEAIAARMSEIMAQREASQPIKERTGGSTFANPDPDLSGGRKAWQLIDAIGGRGRTVGGAQVSERHCNFMINRGDATADDIETLVEGLRRDVKDAFGVALRWEIRRIGERIV